MKYRFIFILVTINLVALPQDWKPLTQGVKYNYEDNFSNRIHTIWIDSFQVVDYNTVYYLNRIFQVCDTCDNIEVGIQCDSCYYLDNQPQFLQREMVDLGNGKVYFRDPASFVILTRAKLNDTWLFDTTQAISAELIDLKDTTLFGQNDSIRTILLSTSDTIILSKNFGLIRFPYPFQSGNEYYLAGWQDTPYGLQIPDFNTIYDFNVNDEFQYEIEDYDEGSHDRCTSRRYRIISKTVGENSISYRITGMERNMEGLHGCDGPDHDTWYREISDSLVFFNGSISLTNRFDHEKSIVYRSKIFEEENPYLWEDTVYTFVDVFKSDFTIIKSISPINCPVYYDCPSRFFIELEEYPGLFTIYTTDSGSDFVDLIDYELTYEPYLGITNLKKSLGYSFYDTKVLVGYIKDSDTTGYIDPELTAIEDIVQKNLRVYPNPVQEDLYVDLSDAMEASFTFEIINLSGQVLMQGNLNKRDVINVSKLKSGVYIIKIFLEEGLYIEKFIRE